MPDIGCFDPFASREWDIVEPDDIEGIVNTAARMALEGIVAASYTAAERQRLEHAARTGEWPLGLPGHLPGGNTPYA